ncbi:hypothetical protein [Bacillus sp. 3255]|uniref:hypothetical protein n=1 Tax=Bacillus sp. 3255 TaxID=2817904 RepID=UPI002857D30C|nr:hypothetical protein [Bacillus sp. 3255]MDR6878881.1 hypothetical protein [Bacillus sp. 3255]
MIGKEKKGYSKKGKWVGAIASTALMAYPFMAVPAAANVESEIPEINHEDMLQTIVIPAGGKKYIDLNNLYYFSRGFEVDHNSAIASVNEDLLRYGILEISANPLVDNSGTGLATFTVTVTPYEGEGTYEDEFNVVIVPDAGAGANSHFTIQHIVSLLQNFPSRYPDKTSIQKLMDHIDLASTTIHKEDPFNNPDNQAPVAKTDVTPYEMYTGQDINVSAYYEDLPLFEIEQFYEDPDDDEENESYDYINAVFTSSGNEYIRVNNTSAGQTLTPLKSSDTPVYLPVVVYDSNGGVTTGTIPFMVRPSEIFELDGGASITLDLHNYFNDIDENSYFDKEILEIGEYYQDPEDPHDPLEINGTSVKIVSHKAVYKLNHLKADNVQQSIYFIIKYNWDLTDNHLTTSSIYENSTLDIDLDQMFPQHEGATVQYSVYHENPNPTVTGSTYLTYGITNGKTLSFAASHDAADHEEEEPYKFTVIGKDLSNHVTYVDRVNLWPLNYYSNESIYVNSLFNWYKDGQDVTVSSTTPDFNLRINEYDSGIHIVEVDSNTSNTNSTTAIIKLTNNSVVYRIPFILN